MVSASRRTRALGQNFLVDRNILDVIERLAELSADDVVLEIGGGQGVLSERLAGRARHVHVVEVDARLESRLREVLAPFDNATLYLADALELDLGALAPAPTKVVANLPYGIAATVILRTVDELPSVHSWVAMVQREVGERLAAAPATPAYGAPSVLAQLACEVRVLRAVGRGVFRPVPNVDSVLVGLRRTGPGSRSAHESTRAPRVCSSAQGAGRIAGPGPWCAPGDPRTRTRCAASARTPTRRARRATLSRGVPPTGVRLGP